MPGFVEPPEARQVLDLAGLRVRRLWEEARCVEVPDRIIPVSATAWLGFAEGSRYSIGDLKAPSVGMNTGEAIAVVGPLGGFVGCDDFGLFEDKLGGGGFFVGWVSVT